MALPDILRGEAEDNRRAADAAARGQSLSGLSGRHTETESRFASSPEMFGGTSAPVERPRVERVAPTGIDSLVGDDPIFRERGKVMPNRKPFGAQEQILAYPPRDGYRRYWANDSPGRIQRFKQAGYAHVMEDGQPVSRITDKAGGQGRASYLMEIPMAWYQEDMARQAAELDARLNDIRTGNHGPGAEDNRYVPKQGIRMSR